MVVGKLTIVSSLYNPMGHAFLIYESYVNDNLDLSGLEGGYILSDENTVYTLTEPCIYTVGPNDVISIGNTGVDSGTSKWFCASEIIDVDGAGVFFNREFVEEIKNTESKQVYHDNWAYSRDITQHQLKIMIDDHSNKSYGLLHFNCAYTATRAWNHSFGEIEFWEMAGLIKTDYINLPVQLYLSIYKKEGSYEYNLRKHIHR